MPGHIGEGLLDGSGQIHKKRARVGRSTFAQETVDPLVELVMRVQGLPFDEMDEIRPVPRIVGEWIGAGKILDIHVNNVDLGVISRFDSSNLWSWFSRGRNIIRCSPKETGCLY